MFLRHNDPQTYPDLSTDIREPSDWKIGNLKTFDFALDISAVAYDPVLGLLALGTAEGHIHLYGGPGVEIKLLLPEPNTVRFLHFGLLQERLVCLDEKHYLHIWDLSPLGYPKHIGLVRWDPVTFVTLSPSHNHILLAMQNGELRTFDLACMRKSPYTIPNMWRLYEEQMLKSGMPSFSPKKSTGQPVEVVIHPRDLNRVFVAYEDGVILLDLKERCTVRAFELIIPAGAPGGTGYGVKDILTHRRSSVTSLAVHPTGHFFAVGYTDGSIGFWATDDSEQSLLVRTLDDFDVNNVDADKLEEHMNATTPRIIPPREPIFKLAWSGFSNSNDPRGGETTLAILGGLIGEDKQGLSVFLFPAFHPSEPPNAPTTSQGVDPFFIQEMRKSLHESQSFFYATAHPVQDFYLLPRNNPHFGGTYDPYAILLLTDTGESGRRLEAREFPPFSFRIHLNVSSKPFSTVSESPSDPSSPSRTPQCVGLPFAVWASSNTAQNSHIMHTVSKDTYQDLVGESHDKVKPWIQVGGSALIGSSHEVKHAKYHQLHRILVTHGQDLTIRVFDISGHLLHGTEDTPLQHHFPETLDALEVDLRQVMEVITKEHPSERSGDTNDSIQSVDFAFGSLECAVTLSSGRLIVYRRISNRALQSTNDCNDIELRLLQHITVEAWKRLLPYFMFYVPERGQIQTCSISEIGFLAVALTDGSLYIIDMRGPVILYKGLQSSRHRGRHSLDLHHLSISHEDDVLISALTWTVSGIDKDPQPRIRLLATRASGDTAIYSIIHSDGGFALAGDPIYTKTVSNPFSNGFFVLDNKTGAPYKADRDHFASTFKPSGERGGATAILVAAGGKGARSYANINGDRIGKADWNSKCGQVMAVQIVERLGSRALLSYTDKNIVCMHSIPHLEPLHTIQSTSLPLKSITIDESGDFIALIAHPTSDLIQSATYGTVFNFRRAYELPLIDLVGTKHTIPSQPQPVSMGPPSLLGTWFKFNQTMTGEQIDDLLGGPERPPQVRRLRDTMSHEEELGPTNPTTASSIAASASNIQSNLYNRLASALNERGQMLNDLEERFNSLEAGSRNMVAQAKRLAAQNAAKSWFNT